MSQTSPKIDELEQELASARARIAALEVEALTLSRILEATPAFVTHLTTDGKILYLSMRQPGFTPDTYVGKSVFDFTDPKDHGALREGIETALRTKEPASHTSVGAGAHGNPTRYFTRIAPVLEHGEVSSLVLLATDVSSLTALAGALEASEHNLGLALAASRMGLWSFDPEDESASIADARTDQIFGTNPGDGPAKTFALIHPEDLVVVQAALAEALRTDGAYGPLDLRFTRADGTTRWVQGFGSVVRGPSGARRVQGGVLDITDRKRVEEALRQSEAFAKSILNSVTAEIAVLDQAGVIVMVNEAWQRFAEENSVEPGQALSRTGLGSNYLAVCQVGAEFSIDDTAVDAGEGIRAVLAGHLPSFSLEYPCHSPTEQRWFSLSATPLGSERRGVVISHSNITDRRRAEDELRRSEEKYRSLFEHSKDGVLLTLADGAILSANRAACEMLGRTEAELVAGGRSTVVDLTDPRLPGVLAERARTGSVSAELNFMHKDGHKIPVEVTSAIFLGPQGEQRASMLFRDITERKQSETQLRSSEERFRELAENIEEVFWIRDTAKRELIYVSPAYEKIWGRSTAELYREPRFWLDAIHPEDRARVVKAAETEQLLGPYSDTFRMLRPDGAVRWIRGRAFPVTGPTGEVLRIVGVAQDVTTQIELQQQLHQSQKLQAVGSLAAGVAHDFNNILATILTHVDLAEASTPPGHPARENLAQITEASDLARRLVQQLLTFGRQQPMERRLVGLAPLIDESVKLLRATIPVTIELVASMTADAPLVLADVTQLQQVVINLCTNAWHALGTRPGRIEIGLESITLDAEAAQRFVDLSPGPFACLSVRDNGAGMTPDTLERLFEPFFTTKQQGQGSGLGLSVVHGIVKGHGGAIEVTSQLGEGSTFRLYLPAADVAAAAAVSNSSHGEATAKSLTGVEVPHAESARTGQTILLVEDQPGLRKALTSVLQREGYRVLSAGNASEAQVLAQANPEPIDLLVTDVVMPGMNGVELCKSMRALNPQLKVLFVSGYPADVVTQRGWLDDGTPYLAKPCPVPVLCRAIRVALG